MKNVHITYLLKLNDNEYESFDGGRCVAVFRWQWVRARPGRCWPVDWPRTTIAACCYWRRAETQSTSRRSTFPSWRTACAAVSTTGSTAAFRSDTHASVTSTTYVRNPLRTLAHAMHSMTITWFCFVSMPAVFAATLQVKRWEICDTVILLKYAFLVS